MALEQIFQSGPASRVKAGVQAQKNNPISGYLKRVAGYDAPAISTFDRSAANEVSSPSLELPSATNPGVDYGKLNDFYGSDPSQVDYRDDPVLLKIKAAKSTDAQNVDSGALAARRKLLTQLGSRDVAQGILGADDPTLGAISDDPDQSTSILGRLNRSRRDTLAHNEDADNKANLWYSTARAKHLQDLERDFSTANADAIAGAQTGLTGITNQAANAKLAAANADAQAEEDAYTRFLSAVAAHPPAKKSTATDTTGAAGAGAGTDTGGAPHDLPFPGVAGYPAGPPLTADQVANANVVNYNPAGVMGQGPSVGSYKPPPQPQGLDAAAEQLAALFTSQAPDNNPYGSTAQRKKQTL